MPFMVMTDGASGDAGYYRGQGDGLGWDGGVWGVKGVEMSWGEWRVRGKVVKESGGEIEKRLREN